MKRFSSTVMSGCMFSSWWIIEIPFSRASFGFLGRKGLPSNKIAPESKG